MAYPNRSDVIFPETAGVVTLLEAKSHLSLFDDNTFDTYLSEIIIAATTHAGSFIGQPLDVMVVTDYYHTWDNRLILSKEYIDSVTAVRYYNPANSLESVPTNNYLVDQSGEEAAIVFTVPQSAELSAAISNPIQIEYSSWHVNAAENRAIKQAVLIIVGDMFKDRETNTEGGSTRSHLTAERLLSPYRRQRI